jgi:hypothetical protein
MKFNPQISVAQTLLILFWTTLIDIILGNNLQKVQQGLEKNLNFNWMSCMV